MNKWTKIRTDYIFGNESLRQLARQESVDYQTLKNMAAREGWAAQRLEHRKVEAGVYQAAGLLLDQLCRAAGELTLRTQVTKVKEKTESGEKTFEVPATEPGDRVDVKALKELTGALKNLKDICDLWDPMERQELELKLRQAQRQLEGTAGADITVKLEGEMETFAR